MSASIPKSTELTARALTLMPGGVSSPVRAFKKVGGTPRYFSRGEGAYAWDEDGHRYLDLCMAWGPLILGHAHPAVIEAVTRAARDGLAFGTAHRHEVALAEAVLAGFPWAERVRFVVSGTEAVQTSLRLARGVTGRPLVLKFSGCYHGHVDSLLVKAGSGLVTQGLADSEGVAPGIARDTLVAPLGDLAAAEEAFRQHGERIAAIILEPLPANNGLLRQSNAYLAGLRDLATRHGALLIFDEVISGFRLHYGGYGALAGVQPDLVTLGKVIGGGLPVAAVLGKAEHMNRLAPLGGVYQAGTMAGNPVALSAGIATLNELRSGAVYTHLEHLAASLVEKASGIEGLQLPRVGSIVWPLFTAGPIPTTAETVPADALARYHGSYARWLERGVYLPPSGWEVAFLSAAHTVEDLDLVVDALRS
jgi:glutamate-1-semialdehyde 2,1-aminomutase